MGIYSLTFDLLGVFSGDVPQLSISYGDQELGVEYAYAGTTSVNLTIDTGSMGFDSTLLRFSFIDSSGEVGDAVRLTNLKIDGNDLDYSDFSTDRGAYFHDGILNLSRGGYTEYDASVYVTDTMLNPPSGDVTPAATVTGTTGDDNRLYGTNDAGDVIDALAGNDYVVALDGDDTINAGDGNDYVKGQSGVDTINGGNGADRLYGGNGNDIVNGGADNDRVYGNDGDDVVRGDGGNDRVYGNAGDDDLYGGTGNDRLSGGAGADELFGEDGDDHLFGGDDNDILHGGNNNDRLRGNAGNDELHGDAGDDDLNGQDGNDTLYGGTGNDTLNGEDGNDILNGDDGNDYLIGGQGADTLRGGAGNDILYGGGMSTVDQYTIRDGSAFGLSGVMYLEETQSFYRVVTGAVNISSARSGAAAATLNGVAGHIVNITSAFESSFIDGLVNDIWLGGTDELVEGQWLWEFGAEAGTYFYDQSTQTSIGANYESWGGGEPNDYNSGEDYIQFRNGGTWNDYGPPQGNQNLAYVIEWNADDVLADNSIDFLYGEAGNDTLYGGGGNDALSGGTEDDVLYGQDGDDYLYGNEDNDVLYGQAGNDFLFGGTGNDELFGGTLGSANVVELQAGFTSDTAGFTYVDGVFGSSGSSNNYASGSHDTSDGDAGDGSLEIVLGGIDDDDIDNMSGAWEYNFTLTEAITSGTLSFSYRVFESSPGNDPFDNGEDLLLGAALDGTFYSNKGTNDFFRIDDPNNNYDSGWLTISLDVGNVGVGAHTLYLGGLLTRKTFNEEEITVRFDDVFLGSTNTATETNSLSGEAGTDILYGSTGIDTFVFEAASAFANTDQINNFDQFLDVIDVSDIISGFSGDISEYVRFVDSGANTLVQVDSNGGANSFSTIAQINNINDMDATMLYDSSQIVV